MFNDFPSDTSSVAQFLDFLKKNHITNYNDYLLFNLTNKEDQFYRHLEFLKGSNIWTKDELAAYSLVAQTIDGDYILATNTSVLVIPVNLNKKDSELFDMPINDFFVLFEDKRLVSQILSVN